MWHPNQLNYCPIIYRQTDILMMNIMATHTPSKIVDPIAMLYMYMTQQGVKWREISDSSIHICTVEGVIKHDEFKLNMEGEESKLTLNLNSCESHAQIVYIISLRWFSELRLLSSHQQLRLFIRLYYSYTYLLTSSVLAIYQSPTLHVHFYLTNGTCSHLTWTQSSSCGEETPPLKHEHETSMSPCEVPLLPLKLKLIGPFHSYSSFVIQTQLRTRLAN